jgi:hypothetical protein
MLTEKAKGKQRAIEPQGVEPSSSVHPRKPTKWLKVRFTEGVADLDISILEHETVGEIKYKVTHNSSDMS